MRNLHGLLSKDAQRAARQHTALMTEVSRFVPAEIQQQIVFLRLENHVLRATVTSAAWAARVRFSSTAILEAARRIDRHANTLTVHVQPLTGSEPVIRNTARHATAPSAQVIQNIRALARSLGAPNSAPSENSHGVSARQRPGNMDNKDLESQELGARLERLAQALARAGKE